jgi:hypothetical protein
MKEDNKMNWKRFFLTFMIIFLVTTVLGYIIHAVLLASEYQRVRHLHRSQPVMPFLLLGNVAFSLAFVWLYARGVEAKPWAGQGLRFGVAVWLLWAVPIFLIQYAGQPFPGSMIAKEIGFELPDMLVLGLLTAAFYRK